MSEKNVPNRRYTDEFKEEAARLANSVGNNEAARRLGVPIATISNWVRRQSRQGAVSVPDVATPALRTKPAVSELEAEISRLRKELASAKLDVEILSKATVRSTGRCNTFWFNVTLGERVDEKAAAVWFICGRARSAVEALEIWRVVKRDWAYAWQARGVDSCNRQAFRRDHADAKRTRRLRLP